jgi:unsaturated rhamnogalacturonyl hydrolase
MRILFWMFGLFFFIIEAPSQKVGNDVTSPLHALKVVYPTPYEPMSKVEIKAKLDRVFNYIDKVTPAEMVNKITNKPVLNTQLADSNTIIKPGDFRLSSYEWGVTYNALLLATETTADAKYQDYVRDRLAFLVKWIPAIKKLKEQGIIKSENYTLRQPIDPRALDDAGAVCAAMIKSTMAGLNTDLTTQISIYSDFISNKEHRLTDKTLARLRPHKNTLWLDDLYMGVPTLALMGKLTGDVKYYDDAVNQVRKYTSRMFNKELGLYMHGWVEGMDAQQEFRWARANGWALMAMSELLDVLPENHEGRSYVLQQFGAHVKGLSQYQSATGFWHQLIDREDSYLETSATAIYAYCIAHGCNKGWLQPLTYAPMANLAWNAVSTKINDLGQVEGTCVGTGMAFDPAFYYFRPTNVFAAHGYGPVILAASEMYRLVSNNELKMNDSAIHSYKN